MYHLATMHSITDRQMILPVIFIYSVIFSTQLFLLKTFKALNGLFMCWCAVKKLLTHRQMDSMMPTADGKNW